MATEIKIKQSKEKLNLSQIEELWKYSCTNVYGGETDPRIGVLDNHNIMQIEFVDTEERYNEEKLRIWQEAKYYLLFDNNNYGSGIFLFFDQEDQICLKITFPTTLSEIASLYSLVKCLCERLNATEFSRGSVGEFRTAELSQLDWFVELGVNDTLAQLENLEKRTQQQLHGYSVINGVRNPIFITQEQLRGMGIGLPLAGNMNNIQIVLRSYEAFMHAMQKRDLYYATIMLYQITKGAEQRVVGYLTLAPDCDTILPIHPKEEAYLCQLDTSQISEIYLATYRGPGDKASIDYQSFLREVRYEKREQYDGNHFILRLSSKEMDKLVKRTKEK